MANITIGYGTLLIALAAGGYFGTGGVSLTAWIPAAFGLPMVLFGWLAKNPSKRKLFMHLAVAVALLAFLGSAKGVLGLGKMATGVSVERPAATVSMAVMALLSAVYLVLAIRSFVRARRQQPV